MNSERLCSSPILLQTISVIVLHVLIICSFRFLGYVDKLGVAFEAPSIATGYGGYIAQVGYLFNRFVSYSS
jgi:hypothetical protein